MSDFQKDDFFTINKKYFEHIINDKNDYLHPSGFLNTNIKSIQKFDNITIDKSNFIEYRNDSTSNILEYKDIIQNLFHHWDNYFYDNDELTICHSVTIGSIAVLDFLYKNHIRSIIFETPVYYATLIQAEQMNFNITKIPSFYKDNFISPLTVSSIEPKVYWITQPRISLGINQDIQYIENIINKLREVDYLVIDEATELMFPSHLSLLLNIQIKILLKYEVFLRVWDLMVLEFLQLFIQKL